MLGSKVVLMLRKSVSCAIVEFFVILDFSLQAVAGGRHIYDFSTLGDRCARLAAMFCICGLRWEFKEAVHGY